MKKNDYKKAFEQKISPESILMSEILEAMEEYYRQEHSRKIKYGLARKKEKSKS